MMLICELAPNEIVINCSREYGDARDAIGAGNRILDPDLLAPRGLRSHWLVPTAGTSAKAICRRRQPVSRIGAALQSHCPCSSAGSNLKTAPIQDVGRRGREREIRSPDPDVNCLSGGSRICYLQGRTKLIGIVEGSPSRRIGSRAKGQKISTGGSITIVHCLRVGRCPEAADGSGRVHLSLGRQFASQHLPLERKR